MSAVRSGTIVSWDGYLKYLLVVLVPLGFSVLLIASWVLAFSAFGIAAILTLIVLKEKSGLYLLILLIPLSCLQLHPNFINQKIALRLELLIHYSLYHPLLAIVLSLVVANRLAGAPGTMTERASWYRTNQAVLLTIAFWASISMVWSPNIICSIRHLVQLYLNIGLFFLPIALIRDEKSANLAVMFWIIAGVVMAVGSIGDRLYVLQHPVDDVMIKDFKYKITDFLKFSLMFRLLPARSSGFSSFDFTSLMINITMPLTFFLFEKNSLRYRMIGITVLCILFFARTLTLNKAGLGAFLFSCLLMILFYRSFDRKRILLCVVFGLICIAFFFSSQTIFEKISSVKRISASSGTDKNSSLSIRLKWWGAGMENVIDNNGAGLGPGGFRSLVNAPHAHNFVLSFFFDYGIIGLICAILFYFNILQSHWIVFTRQDTEIQRVSFMFGIGIAAFMIQALVDFDYFFPEPWIFLGTSFAILNVAFNTVSDTQNDSR